MIPKRKLFGYPLFPFAVLVDFVDWAGNFFAAPCLRLLITPLISSFKAENYIIRKPYIFTIQWTNFQKYWTNFYYNKFLIQKKFQKMLWYKFWFLRLGQICYPTVNGLFRQNKNTPVFPWYYTLPTYLAQSMKHFISHLGVHIYVFIYFVETHVCRCKNHLTWLDKSLIISTINPNYHSICWI